jgi:hypothetical protein
MVKSFRLLLHVYAYIRLIICINSDHKMIYKIISIYCFANVFAGRSEHKSVSLFTGHAVYTKCRYLSWSISASVCDVTAFPLCSWHASFCSSNLQDSQWKVSCNAQAGGSVAALQIEPWGSSHVVTSCTRSSLTSTVSVLAMRQRARSWDSVCEDHPALNIPR